MKKFNIYHRKDGRWEGRVSVLCGSEEKRKFKSFYGQSRDEVEEKIKHYRNQYVCEENTVTFAELYEEWVISNRHRIKESTAANYALKAEKHILPEFGSTVISKITVSLILDFIRKKQEQNLSNRYITDILVLMKSVLRFGVIRYRFFNPMDDVVMPKKQKSEIRLLTDTERKRLEKYISNERSLTTLGIALAMTTGLRIGELCALQWKDIDTEKRILTVRKTIQRIRCRNGERKTKVIITDPKSETSFRKIPVPEFMMDLLTEFKSEAENFVLSGRNPLEPRTMQYRFKRILKNVNLPSVHFHSLRHSFASSCIALGFDIKALSEILGHSSVEITLDLYVHSSFEKKAEYMSRIRMAV